MNRSFSVGGVTQQTQLLKYECFPDYCRESLPLLPGSGAARVLAIGTIVALMSATAVSQAAVAGNTGNGTLTLASPAVGAGVVPGTYQAICIEPATNGGLFEVFDPDGVSVGTASVGVAFTGVVKFTIADGGTDFAAGDAFKIVVPEGDTAVAWDPAGINGSQIVHGIAIQEGYAPDGAAGTVLADVRGPVIINADRIAWPNGATDDQKTAALAALEQRGIVARYS